jgi:hypothetical protein
MRGLQMVFFAVEHDQVIAQRGLFHLRADHVLLHGQPVGVARLRHLFETAHQVENLQHQ